MNNIKLLIIGLLLLVQSAALLAQIDIRSSSSAFSVPAALQKPQELRESGVGLPQKRHTIGFGINTTEGDASTGRSAIMLSALYSYSYSPTLDVEVSIQQMSMRVYNPLLAVSSAMSLDGTLMLKPLTFLPQFRCGFGPSVRWQKSAVRSTDFFIDSTGQPSSKEVLNFQNTFAIGATLKLEYLIPLFPVLDLAVRAQGHIYAWPVLGDNAHVPANMPGGAASLGVFFLFHF